MFEAATFAPPEGPLCETERMAAEWEIYPLNLCEVTYPRWHPRTGEIGPVYVFLLRRNAETLLVDAGIGPPHAMIDGHYSPVRQDFPNLLLQHGLRLGDIRGILITHLHFDHVGQASLFPGVPLYVQRAEWDACQAPGYTVPEWVDFPGANYKLLDGDTEVATGVRAVATPGHSPGHQSVAVTTADGVTILAGQAIETVRDLDRFVAGQADAVPGAASAERLLSLRPSRIFMSHDHADWRSGGQGT